VPFLQPADAALAARRASSASRSQATAGHRSVAVIHHAASVTVLALTDVAGTDCLVSYEHSQIQAKGGGVARRESVAVLRHVRGLHWLCRRMQ
jgi:hypothetical protein